MHQTQGGIDIDPKTKPNYVMHVTNV